MDDNLKRLTYQIWNDPLIHVPIIKRKVEMKNEPLEFPVPAHDFDNEVQKLQEMTNRMFHIPTELLRGTGRHYTATELYKEAKAEILSEEIGADAEERADR